MVACSRGTSSLRKHIRLCKAAGLSSGCKGLLEYFGNSESGAGRSFLGFLGRYFICTDIVLVMQYIYYGTILRRQQRSFRNQQRMRRLANRALEVVTVSQPMMRFPFTEFGRLQPFHRRRILTMSQTSHPDILSSHSLDRLQNQGAALSTASNHPKFL